MSSDPSGTGPAPARRVVLVREWHDHRGGGGCCGGSGALDAVRERPDVRAERTGATGTGSDAGTGPDESCSVADLAADRTGALYRALRAAEPDVEVVVVDASNWAWLVPTTYRALRRGGSPRVTAVRAATRSTTPGAVLLDGRRLPGTEGQPTDVVVERVRAVLRARPGTLPV